ncbi:MAG: cobalt-precorrin-5B (C(1))-methyltransferase CbiD [Chordicoccus sp.]
MRKGFTTGSCAAAAAKAAAYMLLTGREKRKISILTPKGIRFDADIVDIRRSDGEVSCAVIKDGGDDPDVTTGAHIFANVSVLEENPEGGAIMHARETGACMIGWELSDGGPGARQTDGAEILIDGGEGVGRVTKPGLDQPVGQAAINHVPRDMIRREVTEVCRVMDFQGTLRVLISVPEGKELAAHTFNPRLGIEGGISILGTTGIVEPMSTKALLDTIRVEIHQKKTLGEPVLAVAPGNYGKEFMKRTYGYDLERSVACSNFIGDTIDIAREEGFHRMLLTGHIGKLIKVSGGIMNTHSHEADARMELLAAAALRAGADGDLARSVMDAVTTEEGVRLLAEAGVLEKSMRHAMEKIQFYLEKRAGSELHIECMMYSNDYGLLAESSGAEDFLRELTGIAQA